MVGTAIRNSTRCAGRRGRATAGTTRAVPDCSTNHSSADRIVVNSYSHYLSQCWPRSMSPYDVTSPQWVNAWPQTSTDGSQTSTEWMKLQSWTGQLVPMTSQYKPLTARTGVEILPETPIQNWVNIGSDNGLLPDGTKPLPEPMSTYHKWGPVTISWGQFQERPLSQELLEWTYKLLI